MRVLFHYTDRFNAKMPPLEASLSETEWLELYRTGKHQGRNVTSFSVENVTIPTKEPSRDEAVPGLA